MRCLSSLLILFALLSELFPHNNASNIYLVKHYSTSSGLSNNSGYTITQDGNGFIWIGTDEGINRFDGINFRHYFYDASNDQSVLWNKIFNLLTDRHGNILISSDAVSYYDTQTESFRHWKYKPNNPNSLANNRINNCAVDKSGNIWVATWEGLNRIDKTTGEVNTIMPKNKITITAATIQHLLEKEVPAYITSAAALLLNHSFASQEALADSIFKLTDGKPIDKYLNEIVCYSKQKRNENSPLHRSVSHVNSDARGNIWIAYHQHGLSKYDPHTNIYEHFTEVVDPQKSSGDLITSLAFTPDKVWIGTTQEGLKVLDLATGITSPIETDGENYISHLRISGNTLWVADNRGVLTYDIESETYSRVRLLHPDYGILPEMVARCTYEDNQGNIWIGTATKGVFLLETRKEFHYFNHHLKSQWEDTQNIATFIAQGKNEYLWIGYISGKVEIIDPEGNLVSTIHTGLQSNEGGMADIFSILRDDKNNMWIGSYEGGVRKYDRRGRLLNQYRFNEEYGAHQIMGNDIRGIAKDLQGHIYFAIHGRGVSILDTNTGRFRHLVHDPENTEGSLSSNWVYQVWTDETDHIWISSVDGITKFFPQTDKIINYSFGKDESSLSEIKTFTKDSRGLLWLGTEYGVVVFDPESEQFNRLTSKDGLSSNLVSAILEDHNSNIWVSTPIGLDFIDNQSFIADHGAPVDQTDMSLFADYIKSFTTADGLISANFSVNAAFRGSNNWLYFGSSHGVLRFHPDSITFDTEIAPVYISGLSLFNKEVVPNDRTGVLKQSIMASENITLKHHQNVITFNYVSPSFRGAQKVQYAYMLEGFDEDWNYVGASQEATYTNLNAGNYRFLVKATNSDGLWGTDPAVLYLTVKPPFWKTTPAFLFYFILLAGALYLLNVILMIKAEAKIEINKMQEMDALKTKFFTNISHEIRTPLTLISGPLKKLIEQKEDFNWKKDYHLINLMNRNLIRLQHLVDQYLDFRKVDHKNFNLKVVKADIISYLNEIKQAFDYVAEEKNIDFRLKADYPVMEAWFDPEIIEKVTFNLLSNAFKFTPENGTIEITVARQSDTEKTTSQTPDREVISIAIRDSGPGIPDHLREKVFERYFQIKTPQTRTKRGTGIGLSLARELVQVHKGFMDLKPTDPDNYQKGSIFTFYIPLGRQHYSDSLSENTELSFKKTLTELPLTYKKLHELLPDEPFQAERENLPLVLIIEDNPEVRHYLKHELDSFYKIIDTDTAEDGLEIAKQEIPDLIVSDIMLPGMDGTELCERIKTDIHTDHIPVILLTARFGDSEKLSGLSSGADDYMTKPFIPEELNIRIKNLIESRRKILEKFQHDFQQKPLSVIKMCADDKFLKKALTIIEENISYSELDVDFMTSQMGISRAQLYRKFNAVTNQTVKGFVKSVRLKKAAELLASGELNVSQAAYSVGFSDLAYFTRCFKSAYNKTPSAFSSEHGLKEKI